MSDKLGIGNEMTQLDRKNRDFYDSLDLDDQKKFSPYLMIRWGSLVTGSEDLQAYYIMSCNERLNKYFFNIKTTDHKKLQWLLATTVSPDMGTQRHQWMALPKKEKVNTKAEQFLRDLYPHLKDEDITLMVELNDRDDFKRMAIELGWDDKRIKSDL